MVELRTIQQGSPAAQRTILWLVWGALLLSTALYAVIGLNMEPREQPDGSDSLVKAMEIAAAAAALSTLVLRFVALRPFKLRTRDIDSAAGMIWFMTLSIVLFALSESVAVFGLVLILSGAAGAGTFCSFLAVSAVLMLIHAPRTAPLRHSK